jgi:hypothetical protein
MNSKPPKPKWEVADVFKRFGDEYKAKRNLPLYHLRVMKHILECRTAALGGHMEECDSCGYGHPVYNSCRDRHCPKCQTVTKEKWLAERKKELLPVDYFHNVFTLPHELNFLTLTNKRIILGILFKAASETLRQFAQNQKDNPGCLTGFSLVLHTWNQQLLDHFHVHCVIPAGVLSPDGNSWISSKYKRYLFPVKALAKVFRGKFIVGLRKAFNKDKLIFSGEMKEYESPKMFDDFILSLNRKKWIVYSKPPFGGPEKVLEYLGRYTHRVAISNHRITDISDESVTFSYRDRKKNEVKLTKVLGEEFIRRFMLHVIPSGFVRIRHYGFLASRKKKEHLNKCRKALNVTKPDVKDEKKSPEQMIADLTGIDILKCPHCQNGRMKRTTLIVATPKISLTSFLNTS